MELGELAFLKFDFVPAQVSLNGAAELVGRAHSFCGEERVDTGGVVSGDSNFERLLCGPGDITNTVEGVAEIGEETRVEIV